MATDDPAVKIYVRVRPLAKEQVTTEAVHLVNKTVIRVDSSVPEDSNELPPLARGVSPGPVRRLVTSTSSKSVPSPKVSGLTKNSPVVGRILSANESPTTRPASRSVQSGSFKFHRVFEPTVPSDTVYAETTAPLLGPLFDGYNCTIMAYGQSGSGKTYTMMGYHTRTGRAQDRGLVPRLVEDIFARVEQRKAQDWSVKLSISNVQCYMEKILDLLDPRAALDSFDPETEPSLSIRQRTDHDGVDEIFVDNVTWKNVQSVESCMKWLDVGNRHRVVASTDLNSVSSRSHSIFMMRLEQINAVTGEHLHSHFYLVDLAGSETVRRTNAQGLVLQQASHVNKSLSTLGNVISALSSGRSFVPYRDSKLTRLLTHALGGNSRTAIILTCSIAAEDVAETVSTLQFGKRALDMPNKPKVNKVLSLEDYRQMYAKAEETLKKQQLVIESLEKENMRLLALVSPESTDTQTIIHQVEDVRRKIINEESEVSSEEEDPEPTAIQRKINCMRRSLGHIDPQQLLELKELSHNVLDQPDLDTPPPRFPVTPKHADVVSAEEFADVEALVLPPIAKSNRRPPVTSPSARYFTPRTFAALQNDVVDQLTQEKVELEHSVQTQRDEINALKDQLLEARELAYNALSSREVEATPAQALPEPTVRVESPSDPVSASTPEPQVEGRVDVAALPVESHTNLILIIVGALVAAAGLTIILLMHFRFKFELHPAFWGLWSGAAVGTLMLGWGLPNIK